MRRPQDVAGRWVIRVLIVFLGSGLVGIGSDCAVPHGYAHAQMPPGAVQLIPREVARDLMAPKIRDMWSKADQTKGMRALQHAEPLPQGTNVRPAFELNMAPQMLTCQNACWLFFVDKMPGAHFAHPVSIILLDAQTGEEQVMETKWWPQVEGPNLQRMQLFNTLESRRDPAMIFFEEMPVLVPVVPLQNATPPMNPGAQGLGQRATAALLTDGCDGCIAWAIIVCGFNDIPDTFDEDTDGIYSVLKGLGLSDDHIFFVSPHTSHAGVDRETSKENVQWAIEQVAAQSNADDKVLFFYSSHGGHDGLTCDIPSVSDRNDGISAAELDGWLSQITSKEMAIVIEACESGSFIGKYRDGTYVAAEDDLTGPGKTKRVVFTSASTDTSSAPDRDGPDDPNAATDIGSESIYGYIEALMTLSADTNGDGAVSFEEGVQYALANDVTLIRGQNVPQSSRTADLDPARVHHFCYPTSDPDGPYVGECLDGTVQVTLDGTGSSVRPPCDGTLSYAWSTDCPASSFSDATIPAPLLTLSPIAQCVVCEVWLTVTCSDGSSECRGSTVTTTDNTSPIIVCPTDRVISCDQSTDPTETGMATANDNCDLNTLVTYSDTVHEGACPNARQISRTWTATDGCGNAASCLQTIQVVDTTPPVIHNVAVVPNVLWPPNHKMVPVTVTATAADNCDAAPVCAISMVSSNEPVNGLGDGDTAPDWTVTGTLSANLRAERSGKGAGRIYTVTVTCTDACGNSSTGSAAVTVPKSRGK